MFPWALKTTTMMTTARRLFTFTLVIAMTTGVAIGLSGCQYTTNTDAIAALPQAEKEAETQALFDAGIAAYEAGNLDQARQHYQDVLTVFPNHIAANTNIGLTYAQQGDWPAAEAAFTTVLGLEPNNADANANLAWVFAEQGQWPKALERGLVAQHLAPNNAYVSNTLGWIYTETDQPEEAIKAYQQAVKLNPELYTAWLALVGHFCERGNLPQAQEATTHLVVGSQEMADAAERLEQGCS